MSLCKDQPNTPLLDLMRRRGVQEVRQVLGEYVKLLKLGEFLYVLHRFYRCRNCDVAMVPQLLYSKTFQVCVSAPKVLPLAIVFVKKKHVMPHFGVLGLHVYLTTGGAGCM